MLMNSKKISFHKKKINENLVDREKSRKHEIHNTSQGNI